MFKYKREKFLSGIQKKKKKYTWKRAKHEKRNGKKQ